jgi:hypothetical protein
VFSSFARKMHLCGLPISARRMPDAVCIAEPRARASQRHFEPTKSERGAKPITNDEDAIS